MSELIEIPYDVWYAINNHPEGFDEMYYSNLGTCNSSSDAFFKTQNRIGQYFPDRKIYSSLVSYQQALYKRLRKKQN